MGRITTLYLFILLNLVLGCNTKEDDGITPAGGNNTTTSEITLPDNGIAPLQAEADLDILLNQIGDAKYVLLGEASHGTAEFYTWRAAISRRLIQEKGFNIIAIEGDWPATYEVNKYIKGNGNATSATDALKPFQRWPTWMWANQEVAALVEWLKTHNTNNATNQQVGFYGLDVYGLWEALEMIRQSSTADAATVQAVNQAMQCLNPYNRNEQAYAQAANRGKGCAGEIENVLKAVRNRMGQVQARNEEAFSLEQNALVAVNGERYYTSTGNAESWNIRDRHMTETINRLINLYGANAKIIIWEHNTHIGDARYTSMAREGMVNVGQLVREQHAKDGVHLVGFGTYEGTVIASAYWGGPTTTMAVPPGRAGSWEALLHEKEPRTKIINLKEWRNNKTLTQPRGHRAIGVVYNPAQEAGNYVPSDLPNRYDSFIFIDKTSALHPLTGIGSGQRISFVNNPYFSWNF
ncbi:erythromycin esterase family protein [Adhaeribacter aquaticus]|uniref:erythromycin esterase family protein n=1 Tax=Adhaeribacter aquaticus TaxID=299567 RepID=UPI0004226F16|nr:erythromycin esterase family protein [Adhaeribacter aquaticus]